MKMEVEISEETTMQKLLESSKVGMLHDRLEEYGFDLHSIENIDGDDLSKIFPENNFYGPLKRFQASHSNWLKSKANPTTFTLPQAVESDSTDSSEDDRLDINLVLGKTEKGTALITLYEKKKKFIHEDRLELVGLIAEHLVAIKYKMSTFQFEEVSNQIAMVFMGEKKDDYYGWKGGKKTGLLSIAYYNRLAAEKRRSEKAKEKKPS